MTSESLSQRFEVASMEWLLFMDNWSYNSAGRSVEQLRADGDEDALLVDEVLEALRDLER